MQPRAYRHWVNTGDLVGFNVIVKESDLYILAASNLKRRAYRLVTKYRGILEKYIGQHPDFLTSLIPVTVAADAPLIVKTMAEAAQKTGVGPMAAVAGAVAEFVGAELAAFSPELIIENGGDIYLKSAVRRVVGIYAGNSPLTGKIGIEVDGRGIPLGISTSSGTVGHSLSFGKADAATVIADSATLSDAVATAMGNLVKSAGDIPAAIDFAKAVPGTRGVLIVIGEEVGAWGEVKLCPTAL